jgi:hypothetical protein
MEVIEGTAVEVANEPVGPHEMTAHGDGWAGNQPVFLVFEPADQEGGNIGIDLDVDGWIAGNRATFRRPGIWFLMSKATSQPMLAMPTAQGDQFFYHRHHVGIIGSTISPTVESHVIGKKRGARVTRLWLMPNGMVMTGEEADVDPIASRML